MTYKIYVKGNYLYVKDSNSKQFSGSSKNIDIREDDNDGSTYRISGLMGFDSNRVIFLEQVEKENGTPYSLAEWETFYTQNTGNFNGGGTAPTTDTVVNNSNVTGATVGEALNTLQTNANQPFRGSISKSDPTPTLPGIYMPTEGGIFR